MEKQYRSIHFPLEVRSVEEKNDNFIIEGYFALFNDETELWRGYFESIDPKAFDKTLQGTPDIRALFDHDTARVLGRTKSKTLELKVDEKGLYGKILVNKNDTEAVNLYERIKRGDIDQCSFGFSIVDEEVEKKEDGTHHIRLTDINLFEVSVVTFPAYANTSINAREKEFNQMSKRKHEIWQKSMIERIKQNA